MAPPPVFDKLINVKYSRRKSNQTPSGDDEQPSANAQLKATIRRALGTAANRTFLTSTPKGQSVPSPTSTSQDNSPVAILPNHPPEPVDPARLTADDGTERHFDVTTDHAVGACSSAGWQLLPPTTPGAPPLRSRKANQDAYSVMAPFQQSLLVGVYDGHGAYGRAVSQLVRDRVPITLRETLGSSDARSRNADDRRRNVVRAFTKAFSDAERTLRDGKHNIDHAFSGTTATCILLDAEQVYVAWAGDSRAVIGAREGATLRAVDVSWDQKPSRADEKKRVRMAGARVTRWKKNVGPQRVWLPNEWLPGLAMTRSIGDTVLSKHGVTTTPEVTVTRLGSREQFVVVASDGVWEFMSSEEVVHMVDSLRSRSLSSEDAARALVKEAGRRWNMHEQVVDDITAVVVYLNGVSVERRERSIREVLRTRRRMRENGVVGVPMRVSPDGRLLSFDAENDGGGDDDE